MAALRMGNLRVCHGSDGHLVWSYAYLVDWQRLTGSTSFDSGHHAPSFSLASYQLLSEACCQIFDWSLSPPLQSAYLTSLGLLSESWTFWAPLSGHLVLIFLGFSGQVFVGNQESYTATPEGWRTSRLESSSLTWSSCLRSIGSSSSDLQCLSSWTTTGHSGGSFSRVYWARPRCVCPGSFDTETYWHSRSGTRSQRYQMPSPTVSDLIVISYQLWLEI